MNFCTTMLQSVRMCVYACVRLSVCLSLSAQQQLKKNY